MFLKVNDMVRVSKGIPQINLAGTPILRPFYAYSGASKDQLLAITTEVTACNRYRMFGHDLHAKMSSIKKHMPAFKGLYSSWSIGKQI